MGAIKREMNNWKWTAFAITYMCVFAYAVSFILYQLGTAIAAGAVTFGAVLAAYLLAVMIFLVLCRTKHANLDKISV